MSPPPTTWDWIDTLSCGHTITVTTAIPDDRSHRVGDPTICYTCRKSDRLEPGTGTLRTITATKRVLRNQESEGT